MSTTEIAAATGSSTDSASRAQRFAMVGAAGFVAPRHMQAIRDTGNELVAAMDRHDSVGILDSFAPGCRFFTDIERFDRYLEKCRRQSSEQPVDFVSICSPNYLHDAHVRLALRVKAHAICEKPLVINPWNLDQLADLEQEHGKRVFSVLQLRLHPSIVQLKQQLENEPADVCHDVCLTYISRRGRWYHTSWKGQEEKSGGVAMNIGIHFFDLLLWLFGPMQSSQVHIATPTRTAGYLELPKARVRWFLSIDENDLPAEVRERGGYAYRSLTMDQDEIDLSAKFTDLHTEVYRHILSGGGYGIEDARPAINLVFNIRQSREVPGGDVRHPFLTGQAISG